MTPDEFVRLIYAADARQGCDETCEVYELCGGCGNYVCTLIAPVLREFGVKDGR